MASFFQHPPRPTPSRLDPAERADEAGSPKDQLPSISKKVLWMLSPTSSMSSVRNDFCTLTKRFPPACGSPKRYGTSGCIPAVVNSTVGSFCGTSEAEGITVCPLLLKNSRYFFRKFFAVICALIKPKKRLLGKQKPALLLVGSKRNAGRKVIPAPQIAISKSSLP